MNDARESNEKSMQEQREKAAQVMMLEIVRKIRG